MALSRRDFLLSCGLTLSGVSLSVNAHADDKLNNSGDLGLTRFVLPIPYATSLPRMLPEYMSKYLPQGGFQEHKFGANGAIATKYFSELRSPALLLASTTITSTNYLNASEVGALMYSELQPVGFFARYPFLLAVAKKNEGYFPSIDKFLKFTISNPGKLNYSSTGNSSFPHLCALLMERFLGGKSTHIPYSSTGHILPLIAGEVDFAFISVESAISYAEAGQIKVLATTGGSRHHLFKDVPSLSELDLNCIGVVNFGLLANKYATKNQIDLYTNYLNKVLVDQSFRLLNHREVGFIPVKTSSEHYRGIIDRERKIWSQLAIGAT